MFFDHKNIDYAERVLAIRRASKKLINWIADTQHILATVVRVWIDGKNNVLADSGSRAPWHFAVARHLPVPDMPIRDVIRLFFAHPSVPDDAIYKRKKEMNVERWVPCPDAPPKKSRVTSDAVPEAPDTEKQVKENDCEDGDALGEESGVASAPTARKGPVRSRSLSAKVTPSKKASKRKVTNVPEEFNISTPRQLEDITEEDANNEDSESYGFESAWSNTDFLDVLEPIDEEVPDVGDDLDDEGYYGRSIEEEEGLRASPKRKIKVIAKDPSRETLRLRLADFPALCHFGVGTRSMFLEVCSGSAVLTQAVLSGGCKVLEPVDLNTGWDLTSSSDCSKLKKLISKHRPLLVHFAPCCTIFSQAYHPLEAEELWVNRPEWKNGMALALNICSIIKHVLKEKLFFVCENPRNSKLFSLPCYERLHHGAGIYFLDLDMCAFGMVHYETGKPVRKSIRLLTNAPFLYFLGKLCAKDHQHTVLEGSKDTSWSSRYPSGFCYAYSSCLVRAPKLLRDLRVKTPHLKVDSNHTRDMSRMCTDWWPNVPLTVFTGQARELIQALPASDDEDAVMAPLTAEERHKEEEFAYTLEWLSRLTTPATRIQHKVCADGEESYIVHFPDTIQDLTHARDTKQLTFTAYGKRHRLLLGDEKARTLANQAFMATHLQQACSDGKGSRFGTGILQLNGFHGDQCNEFWVYKDPSSLVIRQGFDVTCETFAAREEFCWNSRVIAEYGEYWHCKCLGHSVANPDKSDIEYADHSHGHVREMAVSIYISVQRGIDELDCTTDPTATDTKPFCCGFMWDTGEYVETQLLRRQLREWILAYYWSQSKDPLTGFKVFRNVTSFKIDSDKVNVIFWDSKNKALVKCRKAGGEQFDIQEGIWTLPPGTYDTVRSSTGILFGHNTTEEIGDYSDHLEIDGFPVPASIRTTVWDKALTSFGLERRRLFQMYKLGKDTQAHCILLLHGASRLSLDGFGSVTLPKYAKEEDHELLKADLGAYSSAFVRKTPLTIGSLSAFGPRFLLPILGGVASGKIWPKRFFLPLGDAPAWDSVHFRLTLGWKPKDSSADPALPGDQLCLELFEVAGAALAGQPERKILDDDQKPEYTLTLFFGAGSTDQSGDFLSPDFGFINFDGTAIKEERVSRGFGARFGEPDLQELSRRTGIPLKDFHEALGTVGSYRLHQGLLQRSMYVAGTGAYEWLTVVPDGDWRTVEHGTGRRRLSLRKYVVLAFHCTALGPHRSRDRTMQAIIDAGLWWKKLYQDCQGVVRGCLVCKVAKETPLITGHQRSKDYDGPFRWLIMDFVGPMTPPTARGHRFMFTCACGWSGYYWCVPCMDDTGETAARCLFLYVICDLAGYPVVLGSDRAKVFVEGVIILE